MLRKLLAALGLSAVAAGSPNGNPPYAPYPEGAPANDIYNLLFCDNPSAFGPKAGQTPAAWQVALSSEPPNIPALQSLAEDAAQEGRIRYLAYARLRALGITVPAKRLLGVIVEFPLAGGLDALAAYSEGGVRYINHTGKLAFLEPLPSIQPYVERLFAASQPVVARIGPWREARRPPPKEGQVRLTFLVSEGLYFGEGPMSTMQRDAMASPVIQKATELLQALVALTSKGDHGGGDAPTAPAQN
jgi:hypothetical protein